MTAYVTLLNTTYIHLDTYKLYLKTERSISARYKLHVFTKEEKNEISAYIHSDKDRKCKSTVLPGCRVKVRKCI